MRLLLTMSVVCLVFSGCVSSTMDSVDTQTTSLEEPPTYDPAQRSQAVAEIRAKAGQSSGELTNAFASGDGPNETMAVHRQQTLINQLEQDAARTQATIEDEELTNSQQSIRQLQHKARSHYKNAVTTIEN